MCIIIAKPQGKDFDIDKIKFSHKSNEDGYGIMYFDKAQGKVVSKKGLDVNDGILDLLPTLTDTTAVFHLRYTTVGETTVDNCHPFYIGQGAYMMHNGTINSFKPKDPSISDSAALAATIKHQIDAFGPSVIDNVGFRLMLQSIIGNTINRLAFMKPDGKILIFNKSLGEEVNGLWYSNDYYCKPRYTYTPPAKTYQSQWYDKYNDDDLWGTPVTEDTLVFVYGTLKKGYSNHRLLESSRFVNNATSIMRLAMTGEGKAFPYVHGYDPKGYQIKGEVYEVTPEVMKRLDTLEGYPYHYDRTEMWFQVGAQMKKAWIYHTDDRPEGKLLEEWTK